MRQRLIKSFWILSLVIGISTLGGAVPHPYPVPYVEKNDSVDGIRFTELPASGTIKVMTITGEEVIKLDIPQGAGIKQWKPVVNSSGKPVATGVYYYLIESSSEKTTGKLVIIR